MEEGNEGKLEELRSRVSKKEKDRKRRRGRGRNRLKGVWGDTAGGREGRGSEGGGERDGGRRRSTHRSRIIRRPLSFKIPRRRLTNADVSVRTLNDNNAHLTTDSATAAAVGSGDVSDAEDAVVEASAPAAAATSFLI